MSWLGLIAASISIVLIVVMRRGALFINRAGSERAQRLNLHIFAPIAVGIALAGPALGAALTEPVSARDALLFHLALVCRVMLVGACIVLGAAWMFVQPSMPSRSIRISAIVGALTLFLLALADSIALSDANLIILAGAAWLWWQHEQPSQRAGLPPTRGMLLFAPGLFILAIFACVLLASTPAPGIPLVSKISMLLLAVAGLALLPGRHSHDPHASSSPAGYALTLGAVLPPLFVAMVVMVQIIAGAIGAARSIAEEFDAPLHLAILDAFASRTRFGGLHRLSIEAWLGLGLAFFSGVVPAWRPAARRCAGGIVLVVGVVLAGTVLLAAG